MVLKMIHMERRCCDENCAVTIERTHFDDGEIREGARSFSALGDETRLKIIRLLSQHEALCVCELQVPFEIEQPTISHHLKVLREANLVEVQRRGTWAYYSLRKDALKDLTQQLLGVL